MNSAIKSAEPKSTASPAKSNTPFFQKGSDTEFFFGSTSNASFFSPRSYGNAVIQHKLTIGQPNDKYEQEADEMANNVVQRLSAPEVLTAKESGVQAKPIAHAITPIVQSKCDECEKEEKL